MVKQAEKHGNLLRFAIFTVVCAYFGYSLYFAFYGLKFGLTLITEPYGPYVYSIVSKQPWWWGILYYGSEGIFDQVAGILRAAAGFFALYSAFLYWRKKDTAIPQIKKHAGTALLLEAGYYLTLIPSIIAAFAYFSSTEYLFYFDHTPGPILLFVTGLPCLAMVTVIVPLLLKLRAKIKTDSASQEILKWSCLTGVSYLFVVFWFNYSMAWAGSMVPYSLVQNGVSFQYGLNFLLEPANLASFAITVFGLLAIAMTGLMVTLPAIRKQTTKINLKHLGAVVTALGGYFAFNIFYYYLTGGYGAHPSVWYEIVGILHNPDLWCLAFLFVGLSLLVSGKATSSDTRG